MQQGVERKIVKTTEATGQPHCIGYLLQKQKQKKIRKDLLFNSSNNPRNRLIVRNRKLHPCVLAEVVFCLISHLRVFETHKEQQASNSPNMKQLLRQKQVQLYLEPICMCYLFLVISEWSGLQVFRPHCAQASSHACMKLAVFLLVFGQGVNACVPTGRYLVWPFLAFGHIRGI